MFILNFDTITMYFLIYISYLFVFSIIWKLFFCIFQQINIIKVNDFNGGIRRKITRAVHTSDVLFVITWKRNGLKISHNVIYYNEYYNVFLFLITEKYV